MNFGEALAEIRRGKKVRRQDWSGEFTYLEAKEEGTAGPLINVHRTESNTVNPWVPDHTDFFAEDWEVTDGVPPVKEEVKTEEPKE